MDTKETTAGSGQSATESKSWATITEEEEEKEKLEKLQESIKKLDTSKESKDEEGNTRAMNHGRLIVEQDDPNSPIHSSKTFEELHLKPELLRGIYDLGFNKPSRIQESALPILLAPTNPPKNLIAQAQSGTGKTAAFVLNMLSRVDSEVNAPQAICVAPTRELARQISENVIKMGKFTKIKSQLVVKEESIASNKVTSQIVVGTPGKILDLMKTRALDLSKVKVFVLDEADVLIDKGGLGDQSIRIKRALPRNCQICLFSATFKPEVRSFAEGLVPKPCSNIRLQRKELTLDGIRQLYINCGSDSRKFDVLSDIYGYLTVGQSIIFCHMRKTASDLAAKMTAAGHPVSFLHGGNDMSPAERDRVIDDYRDAKTKVLITTNVLARGIDILQVMLVINYDLPLDQENKPDFETYLHRIGRSGRFGRKGIAINFVHDRESQANLKAFVDFFQKPIDEFPADKIEDLQGMLEKLQEEEKKMQEQLKDEDDDSEEKGEA